MDYRESFGVLSKQINEIEAIDAHTHINSSHMAARGLHDVMLYHMVVSDLYAAGCPSGQRLSENPDDEEAAGRIEEAIPVLEHIQNTSCYWLMRKILSDLYEWKDRITLENWRDLDARIHGKGADHNWPREILKRAHVRKLCTELPLRGDGSNDDLLFYSLEWAFFMRNQWGVFDAPLYELEHAWQFNKPVRPLPVTTSRREPVKRQITTVADVREAMAHYCRAIPYDQIASTAHHVSTDMHYSLVTDEQMQKALDRRDNAGPAERDVYASYLFEHLLLELEKEHSDIAFQFSLGAEPLPFETGSRLRHATIRELAEIISRHPKTQFHCYLSSKQANQSLCTLCRELPNLCLAGYWWHNFFPHSIAQVIDERLDMLPTNRQIGFFSDAYCLDWLYAKSILVRTELARALAHRVERGQYTLDGAVEIAGRLLQETAEHLLRLTRDRTKSESLSPPA
jgi:glucuronate isomerase